MSIIEVKTPAMGESITEATIAEIRKGSGAFAAKDDVIIVLETDKVALEVLMPENGHIQAIKVKTGDDVKIGDVLFTINTADVPTKTSGGNQYDIKAVRPDAPTVQSAVGRDLNAVTAKLQSEQQAVQPDRQNLDQPAISKHSKETKDALQESAGKAAEGSNVQDSLAARNNIAHEQIAKSGVVGKGAENITYSNGPTNRKEDKIKMSRLRSRIAVRLKQAQNTAAILTTFNEIDMSCLLALKEKHKEAFFHKYHLKLGLMPFFVKAATLALKEVPIVNASLDDDYIIHKEYCDIGVAVSTDKGLVVPIIRNTETMCIVELERQLRYFIDKAQSGLLQIADLQGGTFSITNGGIYGSLLSTPIINPPQSAILGMHTMKERPVALGGQVVIRPMMYVALSYDHRIIDGHEAVLFLNKIKTYIEDCACMLIDV